jgi:hypothetical protein
MKNTLLARILRESGIPDLLTVLTERLTPSDLQSLLLEVYRRRAARRSPADLLADYQHNRFVRPSSIPPQILLDFDQRAYALAAPLFEPLELAPVCPLGTTSVVATVDQNSTIATIRNTELVSDCTNVLALECAVRRRAYLRDGDQRHTRVRLCTSQRLLRAQRFNRPGALAHFRLFAVCTAGRDEGSYRFELAALTEHLAFYVRLLSSLRHLNDAIHGLRVAVTDWDDVHTGPLHTHVLEPLAQHFPDVRFELDRTRAAGRDYYDDVCFNIYARDDTDAEHALVDGGFTRWTQQLLSNRKERLLISGIGSERVCSLLHQAEPRT